jgi:hypothetical protein
MKLNTELKKKCKYKFANDENKSEDQINFRDEKISEEILKEVFKLDKVLYGTRKRKS